MTLPPLFVYGTLRDPDILAAVLGRAVPAAELQAATAPDCAAVHFPRQHYPALVRRTGSATPGLLMQTTAADLAALDAFEGDEYRRGTITAMTTSGAVTAAVYWPAAAVPDTAQGWTLERWTREHKPAVLARETELARTARPGTARR